MSLSHLKSVIFFAFAIGTIGTGSVSAGDTCNIIYSPIPHVKASDAVGADLLKNVFNLSHEKRKQMFLEILAETDQFFEEIPYFEKSVSIQHHGLITGGYEGITSLSIEMQIDVKSQSKIATLDTIAAVMGHIYVQDSVLVMCPDDANKTGSEMINYTLTDKSEKPFFNKETAQLFYGMLIAAFNDPFATGYSYYPQTNQISVLGGADETDMTFEKLQEVRDILYKISDGAIRINIDQSIVDVAFPHNDWQKNPSGEAFLQKLQNAIRPLDLEQYRNTYSKILEKYTSKKHQPTK